jgi:hypothetical protein
MDLLHVFTYRLAAACTTNHGILPNIYDGLDCDNGAPSLKTMADILLIVANLTRTLIMLSGAIAMVAIMVAAVYYVASVGDPGRIKRAKDILTNLAIGLVLIIAAYAIVTYIAKGF